MTKQIERSIGTKIGYLKKCNVILSHIERIRYWKHEISSKTKYHIIIGHITVMARLFLFKCNDEAPVEGKKYEYVEEISADSKEENVFGVLLMDKPCYIREASFYIASKLDISIDTKECRMVFSGRSIRNIFHNGVDTIYEGIKLIKKKRKQGTVERVSNDGSVIVKDLFNKNSNITMFIGYQVFFEGKSDLVAKILTTFGNSGKIKVSFNTMHDDALLEGLVGIVCYIEYDKDIKMAV